MKKDETKQPKQTEQPYKAKRHKYVEIQDVLSQYDIDTDNEIKKVIKIGTKIANKLEKVKWMCWTKFPDYFRSCRTDADLYQVVEFFNDWMDGLGYFDTDFNHKNVFREDEENDSK